VDGEARGKTHLKLDSVAAGTREIKVVKGNLTAMKSLKISNDTENKADLQLAASVGYVKLIINPWGKVFVNGSSMGSSPPLDNLTLKPGSYKIRIENPAYKPVTKDVTVKAGISITLQHNF
ncbi:MAG: PEGA domain-containing protein, partial [Bacteroidetes bacterium]|nr:PEGA domain-containing protein [Bacteroidota bacterium]